MDKTNFEQVYPAIPFAPLTDLAIALGKYIAEWRQKPQLTAPKTVAASS